VVSADLTDNGRTGGSFYTARVLLKPKELARLGHAKLAPGTPDDVFIKEPGRTALSCLTKQLRDEAESIRGR
jgi:HlyD family secretion protein